MAEDVTVAKVEDWAGGLEKLLARVGPRFARSEPRTRAGLYVRGLLSAERKNGWTLAEQAGDQPVSDGVQYGRDHRQRNAAVIEDSTVTHLPQWRPQFG